MNFVDLSPVVFSPLSPAKLPLSWVRLELFSSYSGVFFGGMYEADGIPIVIGERLAGVLSK